MGQLFQNLENIAPLVRASSSTITMAATYQGMSTRITVGGQQYTPNSGLTLDMTTSGFNGLDAGSVAVNTLYYVYAVQQSGVLGLVASTSNPSIGPSGFGAWKEIGRFRTALTTTNISPLVVDKSTPIVQSYSSSMSIEGFGTTTNTKFTMQRRKNTLQISGFFRAGTVQASTANIYLNPTLNIDSNEVTSTTNGMDIGRYTRIISTADTDIYGSTPLAGVLFVDPAGSSSFRIYFAKQTGSNVFTKLNGSAVANSNDYINFNIEVPIAEFAGLFD